MRRGFLWIAGREWALAAGVSGLLAAVMTWPALRDPRTTIPQDVYDPTLQAWQVAWGGHALLHDPSGIWNANVSFPERTTLAFSDSLLGYAPAGWLGSGPVDAVLRYNLLFVFAFALAGFGMYVLVRQLGGDPLAAAVAGAAFAYAPWRFSHAGHLNILSTGGIALALAMLARGHGLRWRRRSQPVRTPSRWARPAWVLGGWLVAAWQLSLGFGLGVPFTYILLGIVIVTLADRLLRRKSLPRNVILADAAGGAVFAGIGWFLVRPYLAVLAAHPDARRSPEWLDLFSPPLRGFFTAPVDSWLWRTSARDAVAGLSWPAEMTLLPGFTLLCLAAVGVMVSAWAPRVRAILAFGVVVSVWVAMGTAAPWGGRAGYLILYHLPGFDGSRTPGRLVLWTLLLLCLLAAGAVTRIGELMIPAARTGSPSTPSEARRTAASASGVTWVLLLLPLAGVLAEGVNGTPHPVVPVAPVALARLPAPILVLPTDEPSDLNVMLWSTAGFPRIVNGSSGYVPPEQAALRESLRSFPNAATVAELRRLGVRTVVVLLGSSGDSVYERATLADPATLGVTREVRGASIILTL